MKSHQDDNSILMSAESKINQEDHSSCSASSDPSSNFNREEGPEYFNTESLKKGIVIFRMQSKSNTLMY
jgi:hypothetical protein